MVCLAMVPVMSAATGPDVPMILVVDDTLDARELYAEYLRIAGLRAEVAEDGIEALAKATQLRPSVIIMDLAMPRMDGWEATRRLKSHPLAEHPRDRPDRARHRALARARDRGGRRRLPHEALLPGQPPGGGSPRDEGASSALGSY